MVTFSAQKRTHNT